MLMPELFIAESSIQWQTWVRGHLPADQGLVTRCFSQGADLAAALTRRPPSALVLDVRLAGWDPFTWVTALRAGPWRRPLPLLLLAQPHDDSAASLARLAGAEAVFRKGVDGDALRAALQRVFTGRVWLVPPRAAQQPPAAFQPPALGSLSVDARAGQVVNDFLGTLPVNVRLLAELPGWVPELAGAALTEMAAECQAAGALAAAQCLRGLADRTCKGLKLSATDIDRSLQHLDAAAASMQAWLRDQQLPRSASH